MHQLPLGIYRHYKGNLYEVVGFAKHSETVEDMVIYKALYGEGKTWVRPLSVWNELVEVNGKMMKRFEFIDNTVPESTQHELQEAVRAINSTLEKCEKAITKLKLGTSSHTLTKRRIEAFNIAVSFIERELKNEYGLENRR